MSKKDTYQSEVEPEERLFEIAAEELASQTTRPGLMAKAFSDAEGDRKKADALYVRLRVNQLKSDGVDGIEEETSSFLSLVRGSHTTTYPDETLFEIAAKELASQSTRPGLIAKANSDAEGESENADLKASPPIVEESLSFDPAEASKQCHACGWEVPLVARECMFCEYSFSDGELQSSYNLAENAYRESAKLHREGNEYVEVHNAPSVVGLPTEEGIYNLGVEEIVSHSVRPGLMAKALSLAEGNQTKADALYVRLRVDQIKRQDEGRRQAQVATEFKEQEKKAKRLLQEAEDREKEAIRQLMESNQTPPNPTRKFDVLLVAAVFVVALVLIVVMVQPDQRGSVASTDESFASVSGVRTELGTLGFGDQTLSTGEYVDTYTFEGAPGQRIRLDLQSSEFDTYLGLQPPSGEAQRDDDSGIEVGHSVIEFDLTEPGTYQVFVTSYAAEETGDYELEIDLTNRPIASPASTDANEPKYEHGYSRELGINWGLFERSGRVVHVSGLDYLNFRDLPSSQYGTPLAEITEGSRLILDGCLPPRPEDGHRWCQTSYGGRTGWVYDLNLTRDAPTQVDTPPTPTIAQGQESIARPQEQATEHPPPPSPPTPERYTDGVGGSPTGEQGNDSNPEDNAGAGNTGSVGVAIEGLGNRRATCPLPRYPGVNGVVSYFVTFTPSGLYVSSRPQRRGGDARIDQAAQGVLDACRAQPLPTNADQVNQQGIVTFRFRN